MLDDITSKKPCLLAFHYHSTSYFFQKIRNWPTSMRGLENNLFSFSVFLDQNDPDDNLNRPRNKQQQTAQKPNNIAVNMNVS